MGLHVPAEGTPSKWGLPCLWVEGGLRVSPSQEAGSLSASVHPAGCPSGRTPGGQRCPNW